MQLQSQVSAIDGYSTTASTVGTTLGIAQSVLTQMGSADTAVQQSLTQQGAFALDSGGHTSTQQAAATYLDQITALLNTQAGNNYMFSGSAVTQPSVASASQILNGNGAQAGFIAVVQQRQAADLGSSGLGRLVIPPASGSNLSISEDVAGSPFGFKLAGVSSTLTGATVTGPTGSPPSVSISLGVQPNDGDSVSLQLTLPDGSSQTVTLQATSNAPAGAGQFSIGANVAATAANLQAALTSAVGNLGQTALPAASAMAAANDFFSSNPPQRVAGPPYDTATALIAGTPTDTVFWYTGENGALPPRQTATAQVGPSMTVAYGMRANEQAFATLVANVAVLAATRFSASDPNAPASYQALCRSALTNLSATSGVQTITDVEADLADAQVSVKNATDLNTQTQNTLQDLLQGMEGVNQNQIGAQILTLQTNLSASMSITARLAQLSLVNYLAPSAG